MGFFDRFKRKHEVAPSALPKTARAEPVSEKKRAIEGAVAAAARVTAREYEDRGILVKPVVTEKATRLASLGQYAFIVATHAHKGAIADAVRSRYGVAPASVTVQRYAGTAVRFGRREGTTKRFKKAIVTLPKGQTIDVLKAGEKPD